jgi:hypothetical protein
MVVESDAVGVYEKEVGAYASCLWPYMVSLSGITISGRNLDLVGVTFWKKIEGAPVGGSPWVPEMPVRLCVPGSLKNDSF